MWSSRRYVSCVQKGSDNSLVSAAHIVPGNFRICIFFQIKALKGVDICQVAAGNAHALALRRDRTGVYAWGRSDFGQTGCAATGELFVSTPTLVLFDGFTPSCQIAHIAAGSEHSLAMTDKRVINVGQQWSRPDWTSQRQQDLQPDDFGNEARLLPVQAFERDSNGGRARQDVLLSGAL